MPSNRWVVYTPYHYFGDPWECELVSTAIATRPSTGQLCVNCGEGFNNNVEEPGFWTKFHGHPQPVHLACAFLELIGGPNLQNYDAATYHVQALLAFNAYRYAPQDLPGLFPDRPVAKLVPYEPLIGFGVLVEDESKFT